MLFRLTLCYLTMASCLYVSAVAHLHVDISAGIRSNVSHPAVLESTWCAHLSHSFDLPLACLMLDSALSHLPTPRLLPLLKIPFPTFPPPPSYPLPHVSLPYPYIPLPHIPLPPPCSPSLHPYPYIPLPHPHIPL